MAKQKSKDSENEEKNSCSKEEEKNFRFLDSTINPKDYLLD
jgi:hypothetical protein